MYAFVCRYKRALYSHKYERIMIYLCVRACAYFRVNGLCHWGFYFGENCLNRLLPIWFQVSVTILLTYMYIYTPCRKFVVICLFYEHFFKRLFLIDNLNMQNSVLIYQHPKHWYCFSIYTSRLDFTFNLKC